MAMKRKATTQIRRRRFRRRRRMPMTRNVNLRRDVHYFTRSLAYQNIAQSAAVGNNYLAGWNFSLSNIPSTTEFTALFDFYKITYIKLYLQLQLDPGAGAAATAAYPNMYYCRDYDDAGAPLNFDQLFEHGKLQRAVLQPNKLIVIKIRPATLGLVYNGVLGNSYTPKWGEWIDMANTGVPYYGLKLGIENWSLPGSGIFVRAKYYFQTKGTR